MKRFSTLALCTFALTTMPLFAQPKLEIEGGTTKDWGTVNYKQTPLKTDFVIKNAGTEVLKLQEPQPSCGCTSAPLDKTEIQPGETTVMHVTLDVNSNGFITKTIALQSNDPAQPKTTIYLKANIERALSVAPAYMAFGAVEVGQTATSKLVVHNYSAQDITLSDITATNGMSINLKGNVVVKAGASIDVEGRITPTKAGFFNSIVSMKTTHPDFPTLEFQGYGEAAVRNKATATEQK